MSFPEHLSPNQREKGKRVIRRFFKFNGISVAFLMENMLILYAIRNGLSDPQIAILASFVHLTMPFMILGKRLVAKFGLAKSWGLCWFMRYVTVFFITSAPFFQNLEADWLVPAIIMTGAFFFAFFRSMGTINNTPLMGEITTANERGSFISGNIMRSYSFYFFAMSAVIIILRLFDTIIVYQVVIALGCLIGIYGSYLLTKVPETEMPRRSAQQTVKNDLKKLLLIPQQRRLLFAWSAGLIFFAITIPYGIIAIKNGYGVPDHIAMIYTLIIIAGGIISSAFNGFIADLVGPRPLLLLYTAGFFIFSAFWAFAPAIFYPVLTGFVFLLGGFCKIGLMVSLGHYFLSIVDDADRVGTSMLVRMFSGLAAGLAGSVIGSNLLRLLQNTYVVDLDVYRIYFRVIFLCLAFLFILIARLERLQEWKVKDILGLLVSPKNMRALFVMHRLRNAQNFGEDAENVQKLGNIGSSLSESTIRDYLQSPDMSVRTKALRALRHINFGKSTSSMLLEELKQGEFSSAWIAAEILGDHKVVEARDALREALDSRDILLKGKSMIALVSLEDKATYPKIKEIFTNTEHPRLIVYGAQALVRMGDNANLELLLEKVSRDDLPEAVKDQIYTSIAYFSGKHNEFYTFLQEYNQDKIQGITFLVSLIEECVGPVDKKQAKSAVKGEKPLKFFRKALDDLAEKSSSPLSESIKNYLNHHQDKIPEKLAFFLTIILYEKQETPSPAFMIE